MANHHIVIGANESIDTYIFWTHYYDPKNLTEILEKNGFSDIKFFDNVLPESNDYWNGENVTFYVSGKE
jgi:hypothetical protein